MFWINGDGAWNLPRETYLMAGGGGQNVWIDPSHQLVVVRMGQYRGSGPGRRTTNNALTLLVQALEGKSCEIGAGTGQQLGGVGHRGLVVG